MRLRRKSFVRVVAGVVLVLTTGCSRGVDGSTPSSTTNAPASNTSTSPPSTLSTTSTGPTSATTVPADSTGCMSGSGQPPAGAHVRTVVDVDGDGRADRAWMTQPDDTGITTFGIGTAAGGGSAIPFRSASPVERSALVVNADQRGPVEIILSDGRSASLYAFSGCAIRRVTNKDGKLYEFDLGDRVGTGSGIGCVRVAGGQRLVGLNRDFDGGSTVHWTRTVIDLVGLEARNGAISEGAFHAPVDQTKIDLLDQITCGSLTLQADGVSDHS